MSSWHPRYWNFLALATRYTSSLISTQWKKEERKKKGLEYLLCRSGRESVAKIKLSSIHSPTFWVTSMLKLTGKVMIGRKCLDLQSSHTFFTYLNVLSQSAEELFANFNGLDEIQPAGLINYGFIWEMPVEIHDRFLKSQQIINGTNDQIHWCCVIRLGT